MEYNTTIDLDLTHRWTKLLLQVFISLSPNGAARKGYTKKPPTGDLAAYIKIYHHEENHA